MVASISLQGQGHRPLYIQNYGQRYVNIAGIAGILYYREVWDICRDIYLPSAIGW
jgi:hypothetical protein